MSRSYLNLQKGFGLVELLVTLGIVGVIMSVVMMNQSRYLDSAVLANQADSMALSVAEAQAYGIGVREVAAGSSEFSAPYGLTASLLSNGSSTVYLFFADRNNNRVYDGTWLCSTGGANECLEQKVITRSNYIFEICAIRSSGSDQCSNIGRVDITFKRPETDATLVFYNTAGNLYVPPNLKGARVTLRSPSGLSRSVVVYLSGQISVQ